MKKTFFICLLLISLFQLKGFAQYDAQHKLYLDKAKKFSHMKVAGFVMGGLGAGSTVAGIALLSNLEEDEYGDTPVLQVLGGVFLTVLGVPLTAGGVTLAVIGTYKEKVYRGKAKNLSLNFKSENFQNGLALRYSF